MEPGGRVSNVSAVKGFEYDRTLVIRHPSGPWSVVSGQWSMAVVENHERKVG